MEMEWNEHAKEPYYARLHKRSESMGQVVPWPPDDY